MKRWGLLLALLLSLGMNAGILLTLAVDGEAGDRGAEESRGWREKSWKRDHERHGEHYKGGRLIEHLADRLDLAGEMRERFVAVQRRFRDELVTLGRNRHRTEEALRRELTAPEPDRERIERLAGELGEASRQMERALAEHVLETRRLLDPERERLYLAFIERLRHRKKWRGPPSPRP